MNPYPYKLLCMIFKGNGIDDDSVTSCFAFLLRFRKKMKVALKLQRHDLYLIFDSLDEK